MNPKSHNTQLGYCAILNPPDFGDLYPSHPLRFLHHRYGEPLALRYASCPRQARDVLTPKTKGMIQISTLSVLSGESASGPECEFAKGEVLPP